MALERGATVFRVHDVAQVRDALAVAAATVAAVRGEAPAQIDEPTMPEDELDDDFDDDEAAEPAVTIEITGLSLYTRHGVSEAERELGQRLVFDVAFELEDCDATVTDRVEDTVDYADVCEQVALAAQERSYKTLERLCAAVADRLIERYGAESVRVRRPSPSRRSRCRSRRSRWRSGARAEPLRGLPGPRLQRGRPAGQPARRARRARARHGIAVTASSSVYETAPRARSPTSPTSSTPACGSRPSSGPEALLDACKAVERELGPRAGRARATARGRSTSTCCCWATASTAPSA